MGHGSIQKDPGVSIQNLQVLSSSQVEIEIYYGVEADWEKLGTASGTKLNILNGICIYTSVKKAFKLQVFEPQPLLKKPWF